jgi:ketosteroid isomerase-like protein
MTPPARRKLLAIYDQFDKLATASIMQAVCLYRRAEMDPIKATDEAQVRVVLEDWAKATKEGRQDDILANHLPDVLIYDVLAPMKYEGAKAYRKSWAEWQPETQGEGKFDLEELSIVASSDVAFAHAFIRCGGTMPDGTSFEDLVRATFCLIKDGGLWKVAHQHISKPINRGDA